MVGCIKYPLLKFKKILLVKGTQFFQSQYYFSYLLSYCPPPIISKLGDFFACSIYPIIRLNALSSITAEEKESNSATSPIFNLLRSSNSPSLIY